MGVITLVLPPAGVPLYVLSIPMIIALPRLPENQRLDIAIASFWGQAVMALDITTSFMPLPKLGTLRRSCTYCWV